MKPPKKIHIINDIAKDYDSINLGIEKYILLYDNLDGNNLIQRLHEKKVFKTEQLFLILITQGEATLIGNGEEATIREKEYIVICPDSIIEIKNTSSNFKYQTFVFYKDAIKEVFSDLGINYNITSLSHVFRRVPCNNDTFNYLNELYCELKDELLSSKYTLQKLYARSYANIIIINSIKLFKQNVSLNEKKVSKQTNVYNSFLELLNEYSTTNREVQFYAEKLGITPKYLSAVTIEYSGKNASCWIDEYVITKAKSLLREQKYNIKFVSEELNFPSQSFFGRYFKRITGMSPKQFVNEQ